jgi:hypothetical protein
MGTPIAEHAPVGPTAHEPHTPTGWWSWVTTTDHKRIGILYGVTAFVFFLIGGLEALLIRLQLAQPDGTLVGAEGRDAALGRLLQLHHPAADRRA